MPISTVLGWALMICVKAFSLHIQVAASKLLLLYSSLASICCMIWWHWHQWCAHLSIGPTFLIAFWHMLQMTVAVILKLLEIPLYKSIKEVCCLTWYIVTPHRAWSSTHNSTHFFDSVAIELLFSGIFIAKVHIYGTITRTAGIY